MRLFLLTLIFLMGFFGSSFAATTYTVCPSSCSETTITGAVALADDDDTIDIQSNIANEAVTNTKNLTFTSSNGSTWACTTSAANLTLPVGLLGPCTVTGLVLEHSGTAGLLLSHSALGVGASVAVIRNIIKQKSNTSTLFFAPIYTTPDQVVISRNILLISGVTSANVRGIWFAGQSVADPDPVLVDRNLIIYSGSGSSFRAVTIKGEAFGQREGLVFNNTIVGTSEAIATDGDGSTFENNSITGFSISGSAGADQFLRTCNTLSQDMGAGSITQTGALTYVNYGGAVAADYRLSPASGSIYAGSNLYGGQPDVFGNLYHATNPSIGAIQYYAPIGLRYRRFGWLMDFLIEKFEPLYLTGGLHV